jgi:hypothetical protein
MNRFVLFFTSAFFAMNVFGGVFGSSNYDECVLEKMKGQTIQMRQNAENACEIAFPTERVIDTNLFSADRADITFSLEKTTNQLIDVNVKNESNYKITKIRVLTKDSCKKDSVYVDDIQVKAPLLGNTFTAKVKDSRKVQCVEVDFYGKRIK